MNIILIGFKNCGKTSIGKLVAEKAHQSFIDTDELIEKQFYAEEKQPLTVREIYRHKGEQYFRDLEKTIITTLNHCHQCVIATGGGSVLDDENTTYLKQLGKLIYLHASLSTLLTRLQSQPIPAFLDPNQLEKNFTDTFQQRVHLYQRAANIEISTENKSMLSIAEEITALMRCS